MTNEQNAPAPDADWVMVPREATHEMKAAGMETSPMYQVLGTGRRVSVSDEDAGAIYAAMLAAAPKPAAPREVVGYEIREIVERAIGQPFTEYTRVSLGDIASIINAYLTHPGHKHAQEDAAQEGPREDEYARLWRGRWIAVRVEHLRDTKGYDFETATAYAEADANTLDELYESARARLAQRLNIDSEAK